MRQLSRIQKQNPEGGLSFVAFTTDPKTEIAEFLKGNPEITVDVRKYPDARMREAFGAVNAARTMCISTDGTVAFLEQNSDSPSDVGKSTFEFASSNKKRHTDGAH